MQPRFTVDGFEYGGYHIKRGSIILMSQRVTRCLPDLRPGPDQFKAGRFGRETGQTYHPRAYSPFGAGSRICMGMSFAHLEGRTLLATILQWYVPRLTPGFPVMPHPMGALFPEFGLQMVLESAAHVEAMQSA